VAGVACVCVCMVVANRCVCCTMLRVLRNKTERYVRQIYHVGVTNVEDLTPRVFHPLLVRLPNSVSAED
jgi:hypothetical protein